MNEFGNSGGAMAVLAGMMMTIMIVGFIVSAFFAICMWKIFTKAGEPGWAAIVPVYNTLVLFKIAGRPWWYILLFILCLIPIVNFIGIFVVLGFMIYTNLELAKSFGKSSGFGVGLVFLPIVFLPMLAFGDAVYVGPGGVPSASSVPTV